MREQVRLRDAILKNLKGFLSTADIISKSEPGPGDLYLVSVGRWYDFVI
jgi:hypothetical protein